MPDHNEQDLVHRDEALSMFKQRFPSLHDRDTSMSELCETQGHVLQLLEHGNYHEAYKKHRSQVKNRLEEWMGIRKSSEPMGNILWSLSRHTCFAVASHPPQLAIPSGWLGISSSNPVHNCTVAFALVPDSTASS